MGFQGGGPVTVLFSVSKSLTILSPALGGDRDWPLMLFIFLSISLEMHMSVNLNINTQNT